MIIIHGVNDKGQPGQWGLNELVPVGRRAPRGCDWWRLERSAKMREDLPDRPRLRDERDQPDVTAAVWALERKLLPNPGHQFRPRNPRGVVRASAAESDPILAAGLEVLDMEPVAPR
jgi:hypothetical protein